MIVSIQGKKMKNHELEKIKATISRLNTINLENAKSRTKQIERDRDPLFIGVVIFSTILATLATLKLFGL